MPDYKIVVPSKTDSLRHPKLRALKGVRIGPAWGDVSDPDLDLSPDSAIRLKTKSPVTPRKRLQHKKEQEKKQRRAWRKVKNAAT